MTYISREAFLAERYKQYCENCPKRYGMKKGKSVICYEIGDAPCRSCGIGDVLGDVEDFPAADVRPVVHGEWEHKVTSSYAGGGATFCSVCGYGYSDGAFFEVEDFDYCPHCGATMKVDRRDIELL